MKNDMRKIANILYVLFVSLFILSACDREKMDFGNESDGYGQIQLSSMQLSVDVNATPLSRAVTVDAGSYIVGIYNEDGTTLISEWKYSDMPEIFQLKVGKYKVIAHAPSVDKAVFDEPYCEGSKTFEILKDQVTNIETIKCTLQSIMVTIKYEDAFKELLGETVNVAVKVNKKDNELLNFSKDETRSGYFHGTATDNVVDVNFIGTIDGEDNVPIDKSYAGIAIGSHLIITYILNDANGNPGSGGSAGIKLQVDTRCEVVNIDGSVFPDKEPEIDDFPSGGDETKEPIITGKGFEIADPHNVEDLEDVVVNLEAEAGMRNVVVTITSTNKGFENLICSDELFGSNTFDLAHPASEEQKAVLEGLDFPIEDEIIGQKNADFAITKFMEPLSGFVGEHKFKITITDSKGNSTSATLTLIVQE